MLLSNNPAIARIGPCRFQITNIYNVKSFTNKLKPMLPGNKPEFSELMFTQWERSPQPFPKINHSRGVSLGQRDSFFALKQDFAAALQICNQIQAGQTSMSRF